MTLDLRSLELASAPAASDWRLQFQQAIRDPLELCNRLELPATYRMPAIEAARDFPVFAPDSYVQRMEVGNARDPLLRQILPLVEELHSVDGFTADPVGDQSAKRRPGLIHKYRGRVLLITTGVCAIHCRYCFRRHYPYEQEPNSLMAWEPAIAQITGDASIHEVILSGGDPLSLSDSKLLSLVERLGAIGHLRRLRVHTRLPIVLPDRITKELLTWLTATHLAPYLVLHANHANELNDEVLRQIAKLRESGVTLLNQAVLLRGVNDSVKALTELCETLSDHGVVPYYLNQLDRVRGAAHFEVSIEQGKELVKALRVLLPGYAVPRYVQEVAGAEHKTVLL